MSRLLRNIFMFVVYAYLYIPIIILVTSLAPKSFAASSILASKPLKLRENVESVIKGVLDKYGCIEILLPTLQPAKLWEESGRLSKYIEEGVMLSVKTDKGDFVMAPTAEEAVTDFVRGRISSYKNLPVTLYQIGEKYRNEIRTRGYLLRGKNSIGDLFP